MLNVKYWDYIKHAYVLKHDVSLLGHNNIKHIK